MAKLSIEDLDLAGTVPAQPGGLAHQLEGLLVGLAAAVGKKDLVHAGQPINQGPCQPCRRHRAEHTGVVWQCLELVRHCPGDGAPAVSDDDAPHAAGGGIEVFATANVAHHQPVSRGDDRLFGGLK